MKPVLSFLEYTQTKFPEPSFIKKVNAEISSGIVDFYAQTFDIKMICNPHQPESLIPYAIEKSRGKMLGYELEKNFPYAFAEEKRLFDNWKNITREGITQQDIFENNVKDIICFNYDVTNKESKSIFLIHKSGNNITLRNNITLDKFISLCKSINIQLDWNNDNKIIQKLDLC